MKKLLLLTLSISNAFLFAQQSKTWMPIEEKAISLTGKRQIVPQKYLTYHLDVTVIKALLAAAPNEKVVTINNSTCVIELPAPNGQIQKFKVVESPIMEPGLAAQFPDMKTYSLKGIDDVYANGKLDWNEFGLHGMIRSINGDFFIDPYCVQNTADYIIYYTADFIKNPADVLPEVGVIDNTPKKKVNERTSNAPPATCVGSNLRTYRLAVACTGEYAVAATGLGAPTTAQALAKIVTSVNRVDGVYETEVAIRLVLVANNSLITFTSGATDPFNGNNNANTLIGESQTIITATIGAANYDVGHTFSTGGGGLAGLGVVCNNSQKASGITGSPNPVGDPYDIDYVAHEIGHQFAGNHTFNALSGSCNGNRNAATSMEPGSGITIMGYAGICGTTNDLAPNSIAYFHAVSYDEIVNFSNTGNGNNCPVNTTTGNNPPIVVGSGNYAIPALTPFTLTGSATDPNNDPLTYQWEQFDAGTAGGNWNSGNRPFFRSYTPTTTPTRFFPIQSAVNSAAYTTTKGEYLPATNQTLRFRFTARDNKMGGGGVCYAINTVTLIAAGGPFSVTSQNMTGIIYGSGTSQMVTWAVGGSTAAPISCSSVNVYISLNNGTTYSLLVGNTANDGSEMVTLPVVASNVTTCRIKVESIGNVFYDVNNFAFTIDVLAGLNTISANNPLGLQVAPNPANEALFIKASAIDGNKSTSITVRDVLGKLLYEESLTPSTSIEKQISLSSYAKGVYFVSIINAGKTSTTRIVKE
jgi:hypothetical protein